GLLDRGPSNVARLEQPQSVLEYVQGSSLVRQRVLNHHIKASHQGAIEQCRIVRSRDDDTVGVVVFQELEKRVQHAPNLTNLVPRGTVSPERVEFIEQVRGPCLANCFED